MMPVFLSLYPLNLAFLDALSSSVVSAVCWNTELILLASLSIFQGMTRYCTALRPAIPPISWNAPKKNLSPLLTAPSSSNDPTKFVIPSSIDPIAHLPNHQANFPKAYSSLPIFCIPSGFFSIQLRAPYITKYLIIFPSNLPILCKKLNIGFLTTSSLFFPSISPSFAPSSAASSDFCLFFFPSILFRRCLKSENSFFFSFFSSSTTWTCLSVAVERYLF